MVPRSFRLAQRGVRISLDENSRFGAKRPQALQIQWFEAPRAFRATKTVVRAPARSRTL